MSEFRVVPDVVGAAGDRLAGISDEVRDVHARVVGGGDAAAGTPAEGAVSDFAAHLSVVLPGFGLAADRLKAAVAASASGYARTDAAVGAAARGER